MKRTSFYSQIGKNKRDSVILIIVVLVILLALVYAFSQAFLPELALVLLAGFGIAVVLQAILSYKYGDKVVLKSTGAKPADPVKHVYLINTVEGLALAAGLPAPKVYVIPNKDINAFATGRDPKHASIAVTQGALDKLNRKELEGVLAHEMSHIGNYDIRFFMMVAVFVGLIAIVSQVILRSMLFGGGRRDKNAAPILIAALVLAVVAPIASKMAQLAISRRREYLADATAAKLTRYPPGLASALEKISKHNSGKMKVSEAVSHLFISDPKSTFFDGLFATHPPIAKRIAVLKSM